MQRGRDPLPLRRRLVVAHEIVDVMQQRLRLGEVGVAQQIDVKVRHSHRVDGGRHRVRYKVSGAWRVVQLRGEMYRQVAIGDIECGALGVGKKAVELTFNPSGDEKVLKVKELYAQMIDPCNELRTEAGQGEKGRLLSVAITEAQGAQRWAVKGITYPF